MIDSAPCLNEAEGRGVPQYSFFLINHLGEPFDASERAFENDQDACAHAVTISARRGYPVEVKSSGTRLKLVPLMTWRAEDWLGQTRTPPLFIRRATHRRPFKAPTCMKCRASMLSPKRVELCEACRSSSGKVGTDR